ncbi:hypothetical protein A2707_03175 [Candidatus Saccharibacteria bacterium RIFCSPHIGHO2_01_FULL_45_15]|nr:MAG: hypothetical protein A2707_03175 [Candidatus Saccharibacteria bacterium RIFCSPHIGHO2_01_FULL_45_15]OGL28460.1 MAG: hypothetical protein A3C39_02885 [Candidatus Saccharibacteria bacterium RIFCSPHIGHO2_02_FULL_46_12]OGL32497.1 MAG: hypothetical protein A3E76_00395 [Candidatus Saccharibacteria bacterium RIFCSPHIGHO2_12_FULL_44_22]
MSKILTITTLDTEHARSRTLLSVAEKLGYDARICRLDNPNIITQIIESDGVVYGISERNYPLYGEILNRLASSWQKDLLQASFNAFNKCLSYDILDAASVPMPKSVTIHNTDDVPFLPGVLKIPCSNRGVGVALISSNAEYKKAIGELGAKSSEFLYQEYIEESKGSDKRLLIVSGKCVAAMRRVSTTDDFRANLSLGGKAEKYAPTQQEIAIAIAATNESNLPYAGVDIIDSNRGPLVLEVNPSPGITIGEVTGIDVAKLIIESVTKLS